jgi:Transposase Tn5 dimerisation domain
MVAWRIHTITRAGRAEPEVPGEGLCDPWEWPTLDPLPSHHPPPQAPLSLRAMVRGMAQLGGCFARTGDGALSMQASWQGDQRLHAFIDAGETPRGVNAL